MATKSSKTTLRKADKASSINKAIDKKIAEKKASSKENYKMSREVRPKSNDLSSSASRNRGLSSSYYERYQKDLNDIDNLKKQYRVTNKKDLSKSLGSVASNKGMKKSDVKGTMSTQRNRYYNAMVDADKALDRVNRAGTNKNERAYAEQAYFKAKDKMKAAAKQYNSLKKLKK